MSRHLAFLKLSGTFKSPILKLGESHLAQDSEKAGKAGYAKFCPTLIRSSLSTQFAANSMVLQDED